MNDFSKRLKFFLDRRGMTQAALSDRAEIDQGSISRAMKGKQSIDDAGILRAAQALGLSEAETSELLLLGKMLNLEGKPLVAWSAIAATAMKVTECAPTSWKTKSFDHVPVYAHVRAGCGEDPETDSEKVDEIMITAEEYRDKCLVLRIDGDSMSPELRPGEYGIFEPISGFPSENDICLLCVEGFPEWMVKRIRQAPGSKVELVSENPKHKPILVDPQEKRIVVRGVLVRVTISPGEIRIETRFSPVLVSDGASDVATLDTNTAVICAACPRKPEKKIPQPEPGV